MSLQYISDQLYQLQLRLEDIIHLPDKAELGRGSYGRVFAVQYLGSSCAAKEIHSTLIDYATTAEEKKALKENFMRECYHSSLINHPNIVKFIGIYYTKLSDLRIDLPIMVMELMDASLKAFIEKNLSNIAMEIKLSILHDVSLGLSYLHGHHPAIIHRDLSSNNVLLTSQLVAKIGDLGTAKMIKADSKQTRSRLTTAPGTLHFMPPEALDEEDPIYGTPVDVFSFGGITLHLFSEEWPTPSGQKKKDPNTKMMISLSEGKRRQRYLDTMTMEAAVLKEMVMRCLDDDPDQRPLIQEVSHIITSIKDTPTVTEALQSGRYHIKWSACSDLPSPMYDAYVAVSNGTIYCTGSCPDEENEHNVYCCNTRSNQWKQLPRSGHRLGVIHMVEDKLTIFGGKDSTTGEIINKVTTYNSKTNSWGSCYPDMLQSRHKPGVITSHGHVIVMGGKSSQNTFHDSIEIMNYGVDLLQWKEASVHLPDKMWAIRPTISDNKIIIVGYNGDGGCYTTYCHISVEKILALDQPLSTSAESVEWSKLSCSPYYDTVTVPSSNPPIIIGGGDINYAPTSDISLYNNNTWMKVDSLTSAKDSVGVGILNNHTIVVIGGASGGVGVEGAKTSSLATVEIGNILLN